MTGLTPTTYLYDDHGVSVSASASATTLAMSEEDKAAAAERERERPPFGFARALEDARS